MTPERRACGLDAILPMSCRGRAEAFARRLQSRLHSLGGGRDASDADADAGDAVDADENTWLTGSGCGGGGGGDATFTTLQPRLSASGSESDVYYDFDLDSPGSPLEEATDDIVLNNAAPPPPPPLGKILEQDLESGCVSSLTATSPGSDSSDGNYFDPEAFDVAPLRTLLAESSVSKEQSKATTEETSATTEDAAAAAVEDDAADDDAESNAAPASPVEESTATLTDGNDDADTDVEEVPRSPATSTPASSPRHTFCSTFVLANECVLECVSRPPSLLVTVAERDEHDADVDVDVDVDEPPRRVQRCSSLKTGKTPPGTPGRKKIVRFADVLGLDLADVRTFLDEVPKVPTSAYEDLPGADLTLGNSTMSRSVDSLLAGYPGGGCGARPDRALVPMFEQPGGAGDFIARVRGANVCLENAMVKDALRCALTGTVRVRNVGFDKSVHVRYTLDGWTTFADLAASYVANSCDGFSDTFSFVLHADRLEVGQRVEFAVRFQCAGEQHWDNNRGRNYVFQCLPPAAAAPCLALSTDPSERWASFY